MRQRVPRARSCRASAEAGAWALALALTSACVDRLTTDAALHYQVGTETEAGGAGETGGDGETWGEPDDGVLVLAVIGDYGDAGPDEEAVADLVASWRPDHVLTLGDNNYNSGAAETIDANIGQYYSDFIGDYVGEYGPGSPANRFWPVPGNHDWYTDELQPYLDYFTLPGIERYYTVTLDNVAVFAIDSHTAEPDGHDASSDQAVNFFQPALESSTACWNIALLHHAPYSSGNHGSVEDSRWPFAAWGADLVFAGHDHHYERLEIDGILYFVNGLGGRGIYGIYDPIPGSEFAYNDDFGAQRLTIDGGTATIAFFNVEGEEIDSVTLNKDCP